MIYFLHKDPEECAKMYIDAHVIICPLRVGLILCSYWREIKSQKECDDADLYAAQDRERYFSGWLHENTNNFTWLTKLFVALVNEYEFRFNKPHPSKPIAKYFEGQKPYTKYIGKTKRLKDFPIQNLDTYKYAVDDNYNNYSTRSMLKLKQVFSSINTFRNYYTQEKMVKGVYTKRPRPLFKTNSKLQELDLGLEDYPEGLING